MSSLKNVAEYIATRYTNKMSIEETATLVFADITKNTNKFYEATLHEDGSVVVEWGRIRDGVRPGGQTKTYPGGRRKFDSLLRAKQKKGYKQIETINTSRASKSSQNFALDKVALDQIGGSDSPEVSALISFLVKQNLHSIVSNTTLKFDESSGLFRTPVGIVTESSLKQAEGLLTEISKMVKSGSYSTVEINDYLTLIPRDIGVRKVEPEDLFPDGNAIVEQRDIIDNLRTSLEMAAKAPELDDDDADAPVIPKVFDLSLSQAANKDVTNISKWFKEGNKRMHRRQHMQVAEVYAIDKADNFKESLGNIEQVWHGTGPGNVLSIMRSGLRCSPPGSAKVTGKMFGNGVYGAKSSSKSINYCSSFWGGTQSNEAWLFVCDFAMGKTDVVHRSCFGPRAGYDSVWAKAGQSLANDELIVYNDNQVRLTHIVKTTEF